MASEEKKTKNSLRPHEQHQRHSRKSLNYKCTSQDKINKGTGRQLAAKTEDGPRTALEVAARKRPSGPRPEGGASNLRRFSSGLCPLA